MRSVLFLVRRSLKQHALSTAVTALSVALASGLVMAVFAIQAQTRDAFAGGDTGFDAVLGARGSQLQLVLNAVFHLETSPGNIPWSLYEEIRRHPHVVRAIPYALGDNYRGFRIVGTTRERLEGLPLAEGDDIFDETRRQAVLGSFAAARTGLRVGDSFHPYHGLVYDEARRHEEAYVVRAILAPTNSPSDRVIWIPIEGIFRLGGHVLRGTGDDAYEPQPGVAIPDAHKEVSAVLVAFRAGNAAAGFQLDREINRRGRQATLAWPIGKVMAELFDKLGWVTRVLELVAFLVVAVATGAILASLYNTMNERRREFAILRALGARRWTVFCAIAGEAKTIAVAGALLGFPVYALIMLGTAWIVRVRTGVVLDPFAFHPVFLLAPAGMALLGAVAGIVPAHKAYATDVAGNLVPHS